MPGTAVADLAFSLVCRLLARSVKQRVRDLGSVRCFVFPRDSILPAVSLGTSVSRADATWFDDKVILTAVDRAADVIDAAPGFERVAFAEASSYGMLSQCQTRKTQVLPIFLGFEGPEADCKYDIADGADLNVDFTDAL